MHARGHHRARREAFREHPLHRLLGEPNGITEERFYNDIRHNECVKQFMDPERRGEKGSKTQTYAPVPSVKRGGGRGKAMT